MEELEKILKKYQDGGELSQKYATALLRQLGKLGNTPDSFILGDDLKESMNSVMSDPRFKEHAEKIAKKKNLSNALQAGVGLASGALGLSLSNDQIRRSEKALASLSSPVAPKVPGKDIALDTQINNAMRDRMDVSADIAPAQLQILDQYLKDLNVAKTASTGQASSYGSLAQIAANRRNRSAQGLTPMANRAKQVADNRVDSLLDRRANLDQTRFSNELALHDRALGQYNRDVEAAGSLGATGRQNKYNSINNLLTQLPTLVGIGSNMIQGSRGNQNTSPSMGFGPEIDAYSSKVNTGLFGRFDPYNQNQFYFTN